MFHLSAVASLDIASAIYWHYLLAIWLLLFALMA